MKAVMHQNSWGWRMAAMRKELIMADKNIAEGEPAPSSRSWRAVPTITAIIIIA